MAAKQVILYFDSHQDALHFTLAASSILAGDIRTRAPKDPADVTQNIERITRIVVEDIAVPASSEISNSAD
ncbi:MAG TPA: hypothetical protein VGQ71_12240 [Terriglobales bacterium]|jgi:hypothetical protein|nr:hypothetical protein [Terriglobales bacterium]